MSNRKASVTQSEISRALKAAKSAGYSVARFEIMQEGGLKVFLGEPDSDDLPNEWDLELSIT
jgi:hypothetical protein